MNNINPKEDLASIRDMMEKSSKFSNLSGISIFFTGLLTIIAASLIYFDLGFSYRDLEISYSQLTKNEGNQEEENRRQRCAVCARLCRENDSKQTRRDKLQNDDQHKKNFLKALC